MIEDKLEHDERLRLECLAQAIVAGKMTVDDDTDGIIARASKFEAYVTEGSTDG
jgi:hypothetical protein